MTVSQVSNMLSSLGLAEYIHAFEKESIDGAMLSFLNMEGLAVWCDKCFTRVKDSRTCGKVKI